MVGISSIVVNVIVEEKKLVVYKLVVMYFSDEVNSVRDVVVKLDVWLIVLE